MNDEELEQRLRDELQQRITPPYYAPDTLRQRVISLQMMQAVRSGSSFGMPRIFRKPSGLAATAVIAVLIGSLILFRQSTPHPATSVNLAGGFDMYGRIGANAAWVERGSDLYVTRDDGASWTKGTVPGGRSRGMFSQQTTATEPPPSSAAASGAFNPGFDHLYPVFLDADHAWLVSWSVSSAPSAQTAAWTLTVWRTSDGGLSWQSSQLPGTYKGFGTIQFTDLQHGWVSVYRMASYSSGDSQVPIGLALPAATPTPAPTPPPDDQTTMLSTSDGGATWQSVSSLNALALVQFSGTGEAWGYGQSDPSRLDLVFHSTDGGLTWTRSKLPVASDDMVVAVGEAPKTDGGTVTLRMLASHSKTINSAASDGSVSVTSTYVILTFVSVDGGTTWSLEATRAIPGARPTPMTSTSLLVPLPAGQPIGAMEMSWAGGEVVGGPVSSGTPKSFEATFDGGVTWRNYSTVGLPGSIGLAEWASPDDVWVAVSRPSGGAYLYSTRDAGATWTALAGAPAWPASPEPTTPPYVVGPDTSPYPIMVPLASVASMGRANAKLGWAVISDPTSTAGSSGAELRMTTDGGATWSEPRALPAVGQVQFVDQNRGWLYDLYDPYALTAGPSSHSVAVYRTTDGGLTWQESVVDLGSMPGGFGGSSSLSTSTGSFHFRDAMHGDLFETVAAGPNDASDMNMSRWAAVCRRASTSDGGVTWSAATDGPCVSTVTFTSDLVGYGQKWDNSPTVYVTTDGGQTWVSGSLPSSANATPNAPYPSSTLMLLEPRPDGSLRALVNDFGTVEVDVSTDGGQSWTVSGTATGLGMSGGYYRVARLGDGIWIAITTTVGMDAPADIWETRDGGLTWTPLSGKGLEAAGGDIAFVSPTDGWVAGAEMACTSGSDQSQVCQERFSILATNDGGQSWVPILIP